MARIKHAAVVLVPGALAVLILAANVPDQDDYVMSVALFFAALVGLMFQFGVVLNEGWITPVPAAALLAYLTLGGEDGGAPVALWSAALGVLLGVLIGLLRALRVSRSPFTRDYTARILVTGPTQVVIGLFVGGLLYRALDGRLPLEWIDADDILPLAALALAFLAAYLGLIVVQAPNRAHRWSPAGDQPWQAFFGMILLPLPFAALGAVVFHALSPLAFGLTIVGLLATVVGAHAVGQGQTRYRQQALEMASLSVISQAIHANLDLKALLDVIYQQLHELLRVNTFMVALIEPGRDKVSFPISLAGGRRESLPARDAQHGLIEHVIHERKPLLLVNNVPRRARTMGLTPPPVPAYSWLGVPLLAPDRTLGCMAVTSTSPLRRFSPDDLHLLTLIAAQVAVAIDNSSLYGQARDRSMQLAMLNNVAAILGGTLDLRQVLDFVKSSAQAIASCDAVAVYMWWDDARRTLALVRQSGFSDAFTVESPEPLLAGMENGTRRRQPVIVTNSESDQRARRLRSRLDREGKRAWIEFLLAKGDELLGILVLYYDEPRQFATEEIELYRNFANLAALAISNARLYTRTDEALQRRVEQLSALAEVSRDLSSTLSLGAIYQLVLGRATQATDSVVGVLLLRASEDDERFRLVAHRGLDPARSQRAETASSLARLVLSGEPLVIADVTREDRDLVLNDRVRSQLAVPLKRGDAVLGAILLGTERVSDYTPDDVSFVAQLAAQAHIAIDNVRLFHHIDEARDRLATILDSMHEGLILVDANGWITLTNPQVQPLLGLDPDLISGRAVADLIADPALELPERLGFSPQALMTLLENLAAGEWDGDAQDAGHVTIEIAGARRRFIDRTQAPVRDQAGRVMGVLMVFTDVTEERDLAQARQELTSMIVHDLRGPLTGIMTSLKLLGEVVPSDDPAGQVIEQTTGMASRAVRRLLNLVDSLLDIGKMESGAITLDYEPVDLREPCGTVFEELEPLAQELEIALQMALPPDLPLLKVDLEKTERILLNLVDNALKYSPTGAQVTIRAHRPGTGGAPDGFVRVDVADSGPGIPDEHKERLFDRFAQVDGQRGRRRGTGLGLTFCRLAVEAHGGRVWIEDNPGGGAVFALTLPVIPRDEWARAYDDSW